LTQKRPLDQRGRRYKGKTDRDATLKISELAGFNEESIDALMPRLEDLSCKEIKRKITNTFEITRGWTRIFTVLVSL
jgi:hypothetical protein